MLGTYGCSDPVVPHDHSSHSHGVGGASGVGGAFGFGGAGVDRPDALQESEYDWQLPAGFPTPWEPADNPTTAEKVELGRHLFYDKRLSVNGTTSCASCHQQELAFTDGRKTGLGATGEAHTRSSMSLVNIAYSSTLTWSNPVLFELERQALVPMFGEEPVELGLADASSVEAKLAEIERYQQLFAAAYPEAEEQGTLAQITQALAAFQRTLISGNSPYDRRMRGERGALSQSAQRGYALFNGEKLECFHCHTGFNLSDHSNWAEKAFFDSPYHNTGLYNIDGKGAYPEPNTGVHEVTGRASDMGRFKVPTLRNIAVTAPYMHDGSIATLDEVLDHYAAGGRTIESGPYAGDGSSNPYKSDLIGGFELSAQEREDVIAFLNSLTDEEFLTNPDFSDPW